MAYGQLTGQEGLSRTPAWWRAITTRSSSIRDIDGPANIRRYVGSTSGIDLVPGQRSPAGTRPAIREPAEQYRMPFSYGNRSGSP
jgi:hypothetical protein